MKQIKNFCLLAWTVFLLLPAFSMAHAASYPILRVAALPNITVALGTARAALALPESVQATLDNGATANVGVIWNNGSPKYNGNKAGAYTFSGTLTLPAGVTNPLRLKASVKVVVAQTALTIKSVSALPGISVAYGTPQASLGLPAKVAATLSSGASASYAVVWDSGSPKYAPNTPGNYVFSGSLTLTAGVTNPLGLKASVTVTVAPAAAAYIANSDPNPATTLNAHPGKTIIEFDQTAEWETSSSALVVANTANRLSGAAALEWSPLAPVSLKGTGTSYISARTAVSIGAGMADMSNTELGVYVPDTKNISYLLVRFYTDASYSRYFENAVGAWELSPGWNRVRRMQADYDFIDEAGSGGSPGWGAITRMEIIVVFADKSKPSITFDRLAANTAGQARILFTFDDAWRDVLQYGYPILEQRGFKATTWAIASASANGYDGIMNEAELAQLYAAGWDIGGHTANHPDNINLLTDAAVRSEYLDTQNWLLANGWERGAYHVCYPSGSYNERLLQILREIGVKTGRTVEHGIQPTPSPNVYKLKTVAVGRDTDMAFVYKEIDRAVATGSSLFLMLHRVEVNPEPDDGGANYGQIAVSTRNLNALADYVNDYVKQGKLEVNTISQWYSDYMQ